MTVTAASTTTTIVARAAGVDASEDYEAIFILLFVYV